MDESEIMGIIDTILFVSGDLVSVKNSGKVFGHGCRKARKLMEKLIDVFNFERRGLQIIRVNDSYQLATRPEYGEYIEKFFGSDQKTDLIPSCFRNPIYYCI